MAPRQTGAYVDAGSLDPDEHVRDRQLALARLAAVDRQLEVRHVVSDLSAALVWGLPLLRVPDVTHVIQPTRRAGTAASDVVRHLRACSPDDVVPRHGLLATSLRRTVVDCACGHGGRAGLVIADAALAAGLRRQDCRRLLEGMRGARGVRTAREVVALADDGAESPGETLARWVLLRAGFPPPTTQVRIETAHGTYWADLGWPQWRVVVEYDGVGKYGGSATDVVLAEKRRQDAIEEAGWRVIRVTAADLRDPDALVARILRALRGVAEPDLEPRPYLTY